MDDPADVLRLVRSRIVVAAIACSAAFSIVAARLVEVMVFGAGLATADLAPVASAKPQGLGRKITVDLDVPQSVVMIGGEGIAIKDPDFMPAYLVNEILGGGSFASRLYREVREVRGLAYSVYSALIPLNHAALFMSGTATRGDRAGQTLEVVEHEIHRLAETGPTVEELARAKSYLKGSYALRFDTSSKIASQLVQIQMDDLGIDYIKRRNSLVEAILGLAILAVVGALGTIPPALHVEPWWPLPFRLGQDRM